MQPAPTRAPMSLCRDPKPERLHPCRQRSTMQTCSGLECTLAIKMALTGLRVALHGCMSLLLALELVGALLGVTAMRWLCLPSDRSQLATAAVAVAAAPETLHWYHFGVFGINGYKPTCTQGMLCQGAPQREPQQPNDAGARSP